MKRCTKCGEIKETEVFSLNKRYSDGRSSKCKKCVSEDARLRRLANLEKAREEDRRKRLGNAEKIGKSQAKWRHKKQGEKYWLKWDQEKRKESNRRFRQNNRERCRQLADKWRAKHLLIIKESNNRTKAKKQGVAVIEKIDYQTILQRDGCVCYLCGQGIELLELSFDHVIPLSKGGSHTTENVRPTHKHCNQQKSAKLVELTISQGRVETLLIGTGR